MAKFASDGTLKMLAYLTLLYDPLPPQLIGVEEPENHLHPRLLPVLAEECRNASARSQLFVTTHSPFFVNGLRSEEAWILDRDLKGFTRASRALDLKGIPEFMEEGAMLGDLWMEGHFRLGDPLARTEGTGTGFIRRRRPIR
jgi:predicted ATPase